MGSLRLTGIMTALVTPYDAEGRVNLPVVRELVEFLLSQGVQGFYVCGGTGEGLLLTEEERRQMAETVVQQVRGRVPVVVHVGAITTDEACRLAAHAQEAGADAISSIPPLAYFGVGFEGIQRYYAAIAAACDLPLYVYNIPGATGVNVSPALFRELCLAIPTLAGMKFTSYNFFEMQQIIQMEIPGRRLNVVSGPDEMMIAAQAMGADGAIGTFYNLVPRLFVDAYDAFHAGDVRRAMELQARANRLITVYFQVGGGMSAFKAAMKLIGFDCGAGRPPLPPISPEQEERLRAELVAAGFWDVAVAR
jgi:N-acetylneuraminate lyase